MQARRLQLQKPQKCGELGWVLGTFLVSLGVCMCKKADLGVSMIAAPPFIIYEAISGLWSGFSVGMVEYMVQGVLLVLLCFAVQRLNWRYLLAFLSAVIYGYTLDMWLLIFGSDPFAELWMRWVMLIVGDTITAAGVAFFFRTYLPLQVYELFVAEVSDRYRFSVNKTKWFFDLSELAFSIILVFVLFRDGNTFNWSQIYRVAYHSIGLGTIITTIINAPIITIWGKLIDKVMGFKPMIPPLHRLLARKPQAIKSAVEQPNPTEAATADITVSEQDEDTSAIPSAVDEQNSEHGATLSEAVAESHEITENSAEISTGETENLE